VVFHAEENNVDSSDRQAMVNVLDECTLVLLTRASTNITELD